MRTIILICRKSDRPDKMTGSVNMGTPVDVVYCDFSKVSVKFSCSIPVGKLVDFPWISGC